MQFDTTYLTEAGRSLATGTLGGLDKIQFTRAVASSHDYSATPVNDLKKLTSIEDVQQTVDYSRIIKRDDTTLTMRVDFPSKDVTKAYSLYTVGFYARPENGDEILYGVLPSSLPDYIAAYDGKSNLNDSFQTDTTVSDADNVLITVSQAGSLNEADLDAIFASKHIATIDDIKANIPATVIDGSKPADFKESVILEKGAVDGAGNVIATTKNLADGDAETLKSAKAYADTQDSDKVKTADIDPSVMVKTTLTADDDVLTLDSGNYYTLGVTPKNYPTSAVNWSHVVVKTLSNGSTTYSKTVEVFDTSNHQIFNIYSGYPLTWSGWHMPNENSVVKDNGDDTVTINGKSYVPANAANVVHRNPDTGTVSKPTDFTNLTVNGGKSVATSDDLKSLEASAWRELNFDVSQENYKAFSAAKIVYKINRDEKYISFFFAGTPSHVGNTSSNSTLVTDTTSLVMDLSSVLTEISGINFQTEYGQIGDSNSHAASLGFAGAMVVFTSQVFIPNNLVGVTFLPKDYPDCRIYYTSLVNGI